MERDIKRQSIYFVGPRQVEVREEVIGKPGPGQILVRSLVSAISPGTEQLVYRGQIPADMVLDETITALNGTFSYPFKYGYAVVGQVIKVGENVSPQWQDRLVFAFQPHQSHFLTTPQELLSLPPDVSVDDAVFLPNVETAVNLVMDGKPLIGERVVVFGQGIVGLLTTALLTQFPLDYLATVDQHALRREASLSLGANLSVPPSEARQIADPLEDGADLIFELSGNPAALDQAILLAGFDSRIIVGSWYGAKTAQLDLGGKFHRQRLRLISSQVSTLAPEHQGRWTKARRIQLAWRMLQKTRPARFITHRFPASQAAQAYHLLDQMPDQAIQVTLSY